MLKAKDSDIPGMELKSSTLAERIFSIEPNFVKRAFRLAGPTPGIESKREASPLFVLCRR